MKKLNIDYKNKGCSWGGGTMKFTEIGTENGKTLMLLPGTACGTRMVPDGKSCAHFRKERD